MYPAPTNFCIYEHSVKPRKLRCDEFRIKRGYFNISRFMIRLEVVIGRRKDTETLRRNGITYYTFSTPKLCAFVSLRLSVSVSLCLPTTFTPSQVNNNFNAAINSTTARLIFSAFCGNLKAPAQEPAKPPMIAMKTIRAISPLKCTPR